MSIDFDLEHSSQLNSEINSLQLKDQINIKPKFLDNELHSNGNQEPSKNTEVTSNKKENLDQKELDALLAKTKDDVDEELKSILQTKRDIQAQLDSSNGKKERDSTNSNGAEHLPQEIEEGNIEYKVN